MGIFKTVRDVKRMTGHHGGMPSLRGTFTDLASVADDRGEHEVLADGVAARAVAKGFAEPAPGERFAMRIALTVHPPAGAPYDVVHVFPVSRMKTALVPGMDIPVKIHPLDPQRVAVQWDAQQGAIAAAGGDFAAVSTALTGMPSADDAFRAATRTES